MSASSKPSPPPCGLGVCSLPQLRGRPGWVPSSVLVWSSACSSSSCRSGRTAWRSSTSSSSSSWGLDEKAYLVWSSMGSDGWDALPGSEPFLRK